MVPPADRPEVPKRPVVAAGVDLAALSEREVDPDPFVQFAAWFADHRATAAPHEEVDAVTIATADADGHPSARVVLMRGFDERGFCFYTNYESRKGRELAANPHAAAVWHWPALRRQVRAVGPVERVAASESDAYWYRRPVASRFSARASEQSRPVSDRSALEEAAATEEAAFAGADPAAVGRPDHWGGYRLVPVEVEFWLHRDDRLHDRIVHRRTGPGSHWTVVRLQP